MAMVVEIGERATGRADHVDIGRIGGQQQDRGRLRGETVEPSPAQGQANQRMGEVIQG